MIASERGLAAAQQADNPVVLGSLFRSVAHALHSTGRFQTAVEQTEAAAGVLQPYLSSRADDALLSVYGTLFLAGSVAASRADDLTLPPDPIDSPVRAAGFGCKGGVVRPGGWRG